MDDSGRRGLAADRRSDVVVQTSGLTKRFGRTVALRDVVLVLTAVSVATFRRGDVAG